MAKSDNPRREDKSKANAAQQEAARQERKYNEFLRQQERISKDLDRLDAQLAAEKRIQDVRLELTSSSKETSLFLRGQLERQEKVIIEQIKKLIETKQSQNANLIQNYYKLILETYQKSEGQNTEYLQQVSIPILKQTIADIKQLDTKILPKETTDPILKVAETALASLQLRANVLSRITAAVTGRVGKTLFEGGKQILKTAAEGAAQESTLFRVLKRGFEIAQSTKKPSGFTEEYQKLQRQKAIRDFQIKRLQQIQQQNRPKTTEKPSTPSMQSTGLLSASGQEIIKTTGGESDITYSTAPSRRIFESLTPGASVDVPTSTRVFQEIKSILQVHTGLLEKINSTLASSLGFEKQKYNQALIATEESQFESQPTYGGATATRLEQVATREGGGFLSRFLETLTGTVGGNIITSIGNAILTNLLKLAKSPLTYAGLFALGYGLESHRLSEIEKQAIEEGTKKAQDLGIPPGQLDAYVQEYAQKAVKEAAEKKEEKISRIRSAGIGLTTGLDPYFSPNYVEKLSQIRAENLRKFGQVTEPPISLFEDSRLVSRTTTVPAEVSTNIVDEFGRPAVLKPEQKIVTQAFEEITDDAAKAARAAENAKLAEKSLETATKVSSKARMAGQVLGKLAGPLQALGAAMEGLDRIKQGQSVEQAAVGTGANIGFSYLGAELAVGLGGMAAGALAGAGLIATAPAWLTVAGGIALAAGGAYAGGKFANWLTDSYYESEDPENKISSSDPAKDQDLLDLIAKSEGADYNTSFGNGILRPEGSDRNAKPLTQMTLQEIAQLQDKMLRDPDQPNRSRPTSALGRYQIIKSTLFGLRGTADKPESGSLAELLGLKSTDKFDEKLQDRLAMVLINRRRLAAEKMGQTAQEKNAAFFQQLQLEWESFKVSPTAKQNLATYIQRKPMQATGAVASGVTPSTFASMFGDTTQQTRQQTTQGLTFPSTPQGSTNQPIVFNNNNYVMPQNNMFGNLGGSRGTEEVRSPVLKDFLTGRTVAVQ